MSCLDLNNVFCFPDSVLHAHFSSHFLPLQLPSVLYANEQKNKKKIDRPGFCDSNARDNTHSIPGKGKEEKKIRKANNGMGSKFTLTCYKCIFNLCCTLTVKQMV